MSIEFNCPYCTATVRVGDDAAGKVGRCPKCETRIRIPDPRPQADSPSVVPTAETPTPTAPPVAPAPAPISPIEIPPTAPVVSQQTPVPPTVPTPETQETAFPDFSQPTPAPPTTPQPALADGSSPIIQTIPDKQFSKPDYRRKRKKGSAWISLLIPVVFGSIFVGLFFAYLKWSAPKFTGELTGEVLNPDQSISATIRGRDHAVPEKAFRNLINDLKDHPSAIRSNLVNVRFDGVSSDLKVSLRPGIDSDLVRVPVTELKSVSEYYYDHSGKIDESRRSDLQLALIELCDDWVHAEEGEKLRTLPEYRDSIGYNSFVKGLGHISEAIVDGMRYPCVHEDSAGSLTFLVPVGTKKFIIKQRTDQKLSSFFPSKFEIKVSIPDPDAAPLKPAETFETEREADPMEEMEPTETMDESESMDETMKPDTDEDQPAMKPKMEPESED